MTSHVHGGIAGEGRSRLEGNQQT